MDSKKITCTQKKKIKTKQNYYDMFIPSVDKNMQQQKKPTLHLKRSKVQ
jgi:hypothetical protein